MQNINFIYNLNSLRAFAAINVVIYHILGTSSAYGFAPQSFIFLGDWGASGVHLFFVLSGFVMLHTQLQAKKTMFIFLKSRLIRIVPIYWFLTLITYTSFALIPAAAFNSNSPSSLEVLESLFFMSTVMSDKWLDLRAGDVILSSVWFGFDFFALEYKCFHCNVCFNYYCGYDVKSDNS